MFFALSDGQTVIPLESALDYKQAFAPDEGVAIRLFNKLSGNPNLDNNPNTGGMGGFSPHPWLDEDLREKIMKRMEEMITRMTQDAQKMSNPAYIKQLQAKEQEFGCTAINLKLENGAATGNMICSEKVGRNIAMTGAMKYLGK